MCLFLLVCGSTLATTCLGSKHDIGFRVIRNKTQEFEKKRIKSKSCTKNRTIRNGR